MWNLLLSETWWKQRKIGRKEENVFVYGLLHVKSHRLLFYATKCLSHPRLLRRVIIGCTTPSIRPNDLIRETKQGVRELLKTGKRWFMHLFQATKDISLPRDYSRAGDREICLAYIDSRETSRGKVGPTVLWNDAPHLPRQSAANGWCYWLAERTREQDNP